MRKFALAAAVAVSALSISLSANAMSVPRAADSGSAIVQVEGGCGPGGHRGPYGRCQPNRPYYGRPVYRRCPPGLRPGPYGRCYR